MSIETMPFDPQWDDKLELVDSPNNAYIDQHTGHVGYVKIIREPDENEKDFNDFTVLSCEDALRQYGGKEPVVVGGKEWDALQPGI